MLAKAFTKDWIAHDCPVFIQSDNHYVDPYRPQRCKILKIKDLAQIVQDLDKIENPPKNT